MSHEHERDPIRWLADPALDAESKEILRASAALTPPPLEPALAAELKRGLVAKLERESTMLLPKASEPRPLWPFGVLALAAAFALAWLWPTSMPTTGAPLLREPTDAGAPDAGRTDAGPLPRREHLPLLTVNGNGCGLDLAIALEPIDADLESIALVLDETGDVDDAEPASCEGEIVLELDDALFDQSAELRNVALPFELMPPETRCDASYTVTVCGRDAEGRLATTAGRRYPHSTADRSFGPSESWTLTPSGRAALSDVAVGHAIVGFGNVPPFARRVMMPRPSPASPWAIPHATPYTTAVVAYELRVLALREPRAGEVVVELRLPGGRVARLNGRTEVWLPEVREFRAASALAIGDVVLTALPTEGAPAGASVYRLPPRPVAIEAVVLRDETPARIIDVSWPDTLLIEGVLVHDGGRSSPVSSDLVPFSPSVETFARVEPQAAWDCTVHVELEVDELPDGARSVAVAYAPHRGRPGRRMPLDCSTAHIGAEIPVSVFSAIPSSALALGSGHPRLSVDLYGWDTENGDWHPRDPVGDPMPARNIVCDESYSVIACVRDADGHLSSSPLSEGRWARSGPACFAAGTPVRTPDGERPIETLGRGATIETIDERGNVTLAEVTALVMRGEREILEVELASGATLRVTAEHPLYDARARVFRLAGELEIGDALLGEGGEEIEVRRIGSGERAEVYDLSVTGPHTYFAGGVLAHNY